MASNPPTSTGGSAAHLLASNNPARIVTGMSGGGPMAGYFVPIPAASTLFQLALFIGQYIAPLPSNSTILTRINTVGVRDVYPLLPTDGSSGVAQDVGGVTATNGASGTTSVSIVGGGTTIAYNITYTPNAGFVGSDTFNYTITNPAGNSTKSIAVTVVGVTSATTQSGITGAGFTYQINTNGTTSGANPYSEVGALPAGVTLNTATGAISGTPSSASAGSYPITVSVNTTAGTVSQAVTLTIVGVTSSAAPASVIQNTAFSYNITTNGTTSGANPYSAPGLPAGLSVNTASGAITGNPTNAGNTNVTVSVVTTLGTVSKVVAISVTSAGAPVITTTPALPASPTVAGTVNTLFTVTQINATNPPLTAGSYNATGLPTGLSVDVNTGIISGTPTQSGDFPLTLSASNGATGTQLITIRINPNGAPSITSANAVTTNQNQVFAGYQIVGSNAPITGYTSSGLPTGLTMNAAGLISGTPTISGVFNATVGATNVVGTGTLGVTFTITPTTVPSITSPVSASGTVGQVFPSGQVVASNPPILSYAGSGLPPGIVVNTATGAITGTPTAPGTYNATLTATNAAGPGNLNITFTVVAPAPVGAAVIMTVPLNTPTTVDLAPSITGFAVTGISIVTAAKFGTATVSGTQVTYTPRNNYFGPDTFSYIGFGAGGTSAPAVVTVNVVGRPDPTADTSVMGTINNQVDTARRFSRSQLSNYQRRLESLHRGGSAVSAQSGENAQASERNVPAAANFAGARAKPFPDPAAPVYPGTRADAQNTTQTAAPVRLAGLNSAPGSPDPAAGAFGSLPPGLFTSLMSAANNRSLNLAAVGGAGNAPGATIGSTSFWLGGDTSFGTRDSTGTVGGTTFKTDGVSAGVDRRFSERLVLGVGLGFARDKAAIGTDGTQNRATGTSAAFYGSYQPTSKTFVDALLGYGTLSFDSDRFVAPLGTLAHSHRSGDQVFGSVAAGYEHRDSGLLVSPYGRLDFSVDRLKQAAETGVGQFSLTYFDQTSRTLRSALGVRLESSHETDLGLATPRIRVEYQHGFEGGLSSQIAYSDLINTTRYAVTSDATSRNSIVLGLGSDFVLRNGVTLGIDYQIQRSFAQETSQSVRFRLSKEFDGKGSSASLLPSFDSTRPPLGIRVDAGYTYDNNVTRGRDSVDRLSDQSYSVDLGKGWIFPVTEHTRAVLALSGGAERFRTYEGLNQLHGGVLGEYQYRTSGDFGAPTFAVFMRFTGEQFQSDLRDGYRTSTGISVRKPITDRISLFGALAHNERSARSSVFTGRDNSARLNVDYALTVSSTLYATGEYRRGDTVSTGHSSLESLDIAKVLVPDDVFASPQLISYRIEARTALATIGYNVPFGPRDSLDFSYRRAQSTSVRTPSFAGASRYVVDQFSLVYLLRF